MFQFREHIHGLYLTDLWQFSPPNLSVIQMDVIWDTLNYVGKIAMNQSNKPQNVISQLSSDSSPGSQDVAALEAIKYLRSHKDKDIKKQLVGPRAKKHILTRPSLTISNSNSYV
jgi:hypothetical protein